MQKDVSEARNSSDRSRPISRLMALFGLVFAAGIASAQTYIPLHSFSGPDGQDPYAGVVRDTDGNLYGTTTAGGAYDQGVIYKLAGRTFTVLHVFTGGSDGGSSRGSLILDPEGNLYGTAFEGGAYGKGDVFKLASDGDFTILYSFTGGADGANPATGVIRDSTGNLYGTTPYGGLAEPACQGGAYIGCGVVFKLDATGNLTLLYSFTGGLDGFYPFSPVTIDPSGNLYGTAGYGGESTCYGGSTTCGVVFKLGAHGKFTVLHSFTGGADGGDPASGLVRDSKGNLYGTTPLGGDTSCQYGCGVVYELSATDIFTVLYTFAGGPNGLNGSNPDGGLAIDSAGDLYGTAAGGGLKDDGVLFKLDTALSLTVLHGFAMETGTQPETGVLDSDGYLYGTTISGGPANDGVVFKLKL